MHCTKIVLSKCFLDARYFSVHRLNTAQHCECNWLRIWFVIFSSFWFCLIKMSKALHSNCVSLKGMNTKIGKLKVVCGFSVFLLTFFVYCILCFVLILSIHFLSLLHFFFVFFFTSNQFLAYHSIYVRNNILTDVFFFSRCTVRSVTNRDETVQHFKWMNEQTNVQTSGCGGERKKNPTDNNWEQNYKRRREHWLLIFFAQYISVVGGVFHTPYEAPLHTNAVCASLFSVARLPSSFDFGQIRIRMFVGHTALFTVWMRMMSFDCCSFFSFFFLVNLNLHSNETEQNRKSQC